MSSLLKYGKSADQIQSQLDQVLLQMSQSQKMGNYVQAQSKRVRSQQLRKQLDQRRIYQMQVRHRQQMSQINKAHNEEMSNFNNFWEKKLVDYDNQAGKLEQQLGVRHVAEVDRQREELEKLHPYKVKQSSQCLNLRKMEQHMVKQKNYVQAHKVQQRITQLQKLQKSSWLNNRNIKIQTALNTLRVKQSAQMNNLMKRIKTGRDEHFKDRFNEEVRLRKKFENIMKELKMQQDKQVLALKGQFKSKGGLGSPMGKSKLLQQSK